MPAPWEGYLWGILPIGSSILAILFALLLPERAFAQEEVVAEPSYSNERILANEVHS